MAHLSEREQLQAAWRALAGSSSDQGWRTIPVTSNGQCCLKAGRHFPGNEEAILFGFTALHIPSSLKFPQSRGFFMSRADIAQQPSDGIEWIALCRDKSGSLDLFSMMVDDLLVTLNVLNNTNSNVLFNMFLARIRAWQDFMQKGKDNVLSAEAELGLIGELEILKLLLNCNLSSYIVIDAWHGPLGGLHDFPMGTGAIEVKTTAASNGFIAKIGSLEQLETSIIQPLLIAGIRVSIDSSGQTLPSKIEDIRDMLLSEPEILSIFNDRLIHAGYLDATSENYTRMFLNIKTKLLPVISTFPRLTRSNVNLGINKANYEIDLDLIDIDEITLMESIELLGVV